MFLVCTAGFGAQPAAGAANAPNLEQQYVQILTSNASARDKDAACQKLKEAGFDWREAGCSMCIAMNGDDLRPGQTCVSTSNRNFEGRQGPGGRTLLASPLTAAAAAVSGAVADPRAVLEGR